MTLSHQKALQQCLAIEIEKPDVPTGYTDETWDAAWQEAIVFALTTSAREISDSSLIEVHDELKNIVAAIHRYLNPYNFNKVNGDSPKDSPLIIDIYTFLFGWVTSLLNDDNKQRVGNAPQLPEALVNKRVCDLQSVERLVNPGLDASQRYCAAMLYDLYEAYMTRRYNYQDELICFNLNDLKTMADLLSSGTSPEQDQILDEFFAMFASNFQDPEVCDEQYRVFKQLLAEQLDKRVKAVQADLEHFPDSLNNNTQTDIALLRSHSRDELSQVVKQKDLITPKRLSAILSVIPVDEWEAFLTQAEMFEQAHHYLIDKNETTFLDIFSVMPSPLWSNLTALPGVSEQLKNSVRTHKFADAFKRVNKKDRWEVLMLPEVKGSLVTLFNRFALDWKEDILINLPAGRATDFIFLPEMVSFYEKGLAYPNQLTEIFQRIYQGRLIEFAKIPAVSHKIAKILSGIFGTTVLSYVSEPYQTQLYLIEPISKVLTSKFTTVGQITSILQRLPQQQRMEFIQQEHVQALLGKILNSGLKLASLLTSMPLQSWQQIFNMKILTGFPISIKTTVNKMVVAYFEIPSHFTKKEKNLAVVKLISEAFIQDETGMLIRSSEDMPTLDQVRDFLSVLPLDHWRRYLSLQGVEEFLTWEITNSIHLINTLQILSEDKHWALLALSPGVMKCFIQSLKENSDKTDQLVALLNPNTGSLPHRQVVFDAMKQAYGEMDRNQKRLIQNQKFLFFHPAYQPQDRAMYDALAWSLRGYYPRSNPA